MESRALEYAGNRLSLGIREGLERRPWLSPSEAEEVQPHLHPRDPHCGDDLGMYRAHNLLTLESLSPEQQRRISKETLDISAPIANRLGIGWLKAELEDGSFKYVRPEKYQSIVDRMHQDADARNALVQTVCDAVERELKS